MRLKTEERQSLLLLLSRELFPFNQKKILSSIVRGLEMFIY